MNANPFALRTFEDLLDFKNDQIIGVLRLAVAVKCSRSTGENQVSQIDRLLDEFVGGETLSRANTTTGQTERAGKDPENQNE
jgi:hypothetical protein